MNHLRLTAALTGLMFFSMLPRADADEALAQSRLAELSQMTELLEGFSMRSETWTGALALDEEMVVEVSLSVGNEYVVLLTSDTLQHGIVVEIIDEDQVVVARSEPSGAEVLCRVVPAATGTFTVHIVRPLRDAPVETLTEDLTPPDDVERPSATSDATVSVVSGQEAPDDRPTPVSQPMTAIFAARLGYR